MLFRINVKKNLMFDTYKQGAFFLKHLKIREILTITYEWFKSVSNVDVCVKLYISLTSVIKWYSIFNNILYHSYYCTINEIKIEEKVVY